MERLASPSRQPEWHAGLPRRIDLVAPDARYVLYQNRAGVYFDIDTTTTSYRDRHGDLQQRVSYEWFEVGDAAKARERCEEYGMTILRDIEDMPPEAEPGEKLATLYIRLPPSLKAAIDDKAKAQGVSANVFALRCLEGCVPLAE